MKRILLCAALTAGVAVAPLAASASGVKVGTLTCNESGGWGYVIGGSHAVNCTFHGNGRTEHYVGKISKLGVDIGYQSAGTLVWSVFAPTEGMRHGALGGHYGGVTAGAAVGVGVGANALVGGNDRSFTLQPVSVEGTTGLNIAAGVGELTLHPVG
ncbi:MAG TPA: DUF992 domain-containing protein [Caulobacteraceae bacterium]|jgi:hypothetical protein